MTRSRILVATSFCLAFAFPAFAQKPATGGDSAKKPADAKPDAEEKSYKDKEFKFEWEVPEKLTTWHIEVPERKGSQRVVRMTHAIGGKKDRITVSLHAYEAATMKLTDKELFEKWKFNLQDTFSEMAKNDTNEKDKFHGLSAISIKINGRNKGEKKDIWDRQAFVFKKGGILFAWVIDAESGMIEKYKADLEEIAKSFKFK